MFGYGFLFNNIETASKSASWVVSLIGKNPDQDKPHTFQFVFASGTGLYFVLVSIVKFILYLALGALRGVAEWICPCCFEKKPKKVDYDPKQINDMMDAEKRNTADIEMGNLKMGVDDGSEFIVSEKKVSRKPSRKDSKKRIEDGMETERKNSRKKNKSYDEDSDEGHMKQLEYKSQNEISEYKKPKKIKSLDSEGKPKKSKVKRSATFDEADRKSNERTKLKATSKSTENLVSNDYSENSDKSEVENESVKPKKKQRIKRQYSMEEIDDISNNKRKGLKKSNNKSYEEDETPKKSNIKRSAILDGADRKKRNEKNKLKASKSTENLDTEDYNGKNKSDVESGSLKPKRKISVKRTDAIEEIDETTNKTSRRKGSKKTNKKSFEDDSDPEYQEEKGSKNRERKRSKIHEKNSNDSDSNELEISSKPTPIVVSAPLPPPPPPPTLSGPTTFAPSFQDSLKAQVLKRTGRQNSAT